jgi:protein-glutamine gamma-glutamyltransferase
MVRINGNTVTSADLSGLIRPGSIKQRIAAEMMQSNTVFTYPSLSILDFELDSRESIVNMSERLNNSLFSFRLFKDSICNQAYWDRTYEGGFRLKRDARPHEAIRDIFKNSKLYGTECATAIVIVFYLGLVEVMPEGLFDRLFADIYLMDWKYLDRDLGVRTYGGVKDSLPGDCLYFINPDVNTETPEWQGENVIQLLNGYYYGHGIGIATANTIIRELNRNRFSGSQNSAHLLDQIVKPNYQYLALRTEEYNAAQRYSQSS